MPVIRMIAQALPHRIRVPDRTRRTVRSNMRSTSDAPSTSVLASVDALGVGVSILVRDGGEPGAVDRGRSAWRDAVSSPGNTQLRTVEVSLSGEDDVAGAMSTSLAGECTERSVPAESLADGGRVQ